MQESKQEVTKVASLYKMWQTAYKVYHLTLFMLGNFACFFFFCRLWILLFLFFLINFFKKIFQEYLQSVKQFGSRSDATFCRT